MKQLILFPFLFVGVIALNEPTPSGLKNVTPGNAPSFTPIGNKGLNIGTQNEPGSSKMSVKEFKSQDFCYTELKDFEFDVHFNVVSATIYFSGTNFRYPEQGTINGSSLKTVRSLMDRCAPGSIVIFDAVKVMGPDKQLRTIQGLTIMLY